MSGSPFGILEYLTADKASEAQSESAGQSLDLQRQMYQQQRQDLAPWQQAGAGAINALWGTPATSEQTIQGAPIYGTIQGQNTLQPQDEQPVWHQIMDYNWEASQMQPKWVFAPMTTNAISAPAAPQQVITGYQPNQTIPATPGTQGLIQKGPGEFTESPSYQLTLQQGLQGQQRAASATGRLGSGAYLKDATQYAKNLASEEYQNFLNRYYQSLEPYFTMMTGGTRAAATTSQMGSNTANALSGLQQYKGNAQAAGNLGAAYPWTQNINQIPNYLSAYQGQNNTLANSNALNQYWQGANFTPNQMNTMTWL
jgi:hypothetical protein